MRNKIPAILCIGLFLISMVNFSIAEETDKNDDVIIELIPVNEPVVDTNLIDYPLVVITEPQNGDIIHIPYLEVLGYAKDPDGLNHVEWKWEWAYGTYTNESSLDVATMYNFRFRMYNLPEGWHKVTVTFCNINDNCSSDDVTITYVENTAPAKPGRPYGPDSGFVGTEYSFTTHSTDAEEDTIRYGWDWDGDNVVDEWTDYYESGETVQANHSWDIADTYTIKVMAEDDKGGQSDLSSPLAIIIRDNLPPAKPTMPTGPGTGTPGRSYSYTSSSTDANNDRIYYMFDWDDGTELEWIGPYNSGDTVSVSHIWGNKGSFSVKVKAKDDPNNDGDLSDGLESVWSDPLPVTMPKTKTVTILDLLLEKLPFLKQIFSLFIEKV